MWHRQRVLAALQAGEPLDYIFFWGPQPKDPAVLDASCLSQWFARPFTVDGATFPTAEHFMMSRKARLFRDAEAEARIMAAATPTEARQEGRTVRGFSEETWVKHRSDIVRAGNVAKFGEHADLRAFLLGTAPKVLVEASPSDAIWGIGLGQSSPEIRDPMRWRGQNLLGFILMDVREALAG